MHSVFIFFAILAFSSAQRQARIVSSPQSVNVSSGDHAVFNCTAIATFINWEINGDSVNAELIDRGFEEQELLVLNISQSLRMRSLRVLGSPDSDNTDIVCVAIIQLSATEFVGNSSDTALLLVQGLLESVSNLTVVLINSTTVLISWSPPFTLEGVPILGYNVTITNTTSGENETMSVEGNTTMLYYSIDHPDPDNFTVTVVPINGAGPGVAATALLFDVPVMSTTSVLPSPTPSTSIFQSPHPSSTQDVPPLMATSTATVSVRVTPSLMGPTGTDSSLGPIIGGISGGVILVLLVIALCVIGMRWRKVHKRIRNTLAVHYDISSNLYQIHTDDFEEKGPSNKSPPPSAISSGMNTTLTDSSHRGDSGIATDISIDINEDTVQTTSTAVSPNETFDSKISEEQLIDDKAHDHVQNKSVTPPEAQPIKEIFPTVEEFDTPLSVPKSPQSVVSFSIPLSHDLKKYQVPDDDRLPQVVTVTAVAVSGEQSEYSMFVVPNSKPVIVRELHVNPQKKTGKKGLNYLFVPKQSQAQVYLLPDNDTLSEYTDYSALSQDANSDELSEAVLPTLRRSSSQFSIVDGLSEASQLYAEFSSHPFGYTDPRTAYKRIQHYKKKKMYHSEKAEMEPLLLAVSESSDTDDSPEVSAPNTPCVAVQSDDDTPRVSDESPQVIIEDNQVWEQFFGAQVEKRSPAVSAYEQVISAAQKNSPAKQETSHGYTYQKEDSPIQASTTTQPKEQLHYAELDKFRKNRPTAATPMDNVLYAIISPATHERTYGNVGDQRRQAKVHGVPSMKHILQISQQVAHKWRLVGLQLGVDPAELDQIASECGSDQCCSELFRKWAASEVTVSCPFTWKGVIEALDSSLVRETTLARSLESTYL